MAVILGIAGGILAIIATGAAVAYRAFTQMVN